MNVEVFKAAQEAYAKGDYSRALEGFIICTRDVGGLSPADLSKFYHLIGNCYVKSDDPRSAAEYFLKALKPELAVPATLLVHKTVVVAASFLSFVATTILV